MAKRTYIDAIEENYHHMTCAHQNDVIVFWDEDYTTYMFESELGFVFAESLLEDALNSIGTRQ